MEKVEEKEEKEEKKKNSEKSIEDIYKKFYSMPSYPVLLLGIPFVTLYVKYQKKVKPVSS